MGVTTTASTRDVLRAAFPAALREIVDEVVSRLRPTITPTMETAIAPWPIWVQGEAIRIPSRVYFPTQGGPALRSSALAKVRACIFSLHHDGYVRQAQVATLLGDDDPWMVPFVVHLVGQYVLEVVEAIDEHRDRLAGPHYRAFARENPAFLELTRQRATSYWNCYYRRRFPQQERYAPLLLLRGLIEAGSSLSSS